MHLAEHIWLVFFESIGESIGELFQYGACHTPHAVPHTPTYQHPILHTADPQADLTSFNNPLLLSQTPNYQPPSKKCKQSSIYTADSSPLHCASCGVINASAQRQCHRIGVARKGTATPRSSFSLSPHGAQEAVPSKLLHYSYGGELGAEFNMCWMGSRNWESQLS
jgi:hypothetical protein